MCLRLSLILWGPLMSRRLLIAGTTGVLVGAILAVMANPAKADLITTTLTDSNLTGTTGPYGTVEINLNSAGTIATFTFTSASGYELVDSSIADLNVNSSDFSFTLVTDPYFKSDSISTTKPTQVDGWGTFNFTMDNKGATGNAITSLSFTLTDLGGATWSSAADVLVDNAAGYAAAAHVYVTSTKGTTGYAAGVNVTQN